MCCIEHMLSQLNIKNIKNHRVLFISLFEYSGLLDELSILIYYNRSVECRDSCPMIRVGQTGPTLCKVL
jgi:hypothetical protein